jgi:hypothetical protein
LCSLTLQDRNIRTPIGLNMTFGEKLNEEHPAMMRSGVRKSTQIGAALLIAAASLTLSGCGGSDSSAGAATEAPATEAPVTEAPATEAPATEAPVTEAPATEAPATEAPAASETVSQQNAVRSAEQYLSFAPFSRSGLIDQLEFEGYSTEDATYGVDAQNADWNEQAAKSGESYLEISAFSRSGLIDQLEFEGYTSEQAAYGADANGL